MKIKRKALSLLSCLALLVSSIPSTAVFVSAQGDTLTSPGDPKLVTINGTPNNVTAVFANGTDIEVTYDDASGFNIVSWTDAEGARKTLPSVPTTADVFAGCHGSSTPVGTDDDPVEIVINGAKLNTVYGGGLHESTVKNVKITVKGDSTLKWVCGGGANCLVHCQEDACNDKGWKNDAANSKTLVEKAEVNIEGGSVAQDVYGGGEGYSKTVNTTVNIKGGTINSVCAGGSNGATTNSEVNIENGTITYLYSVNRGTMESSAVTVKGGEIANLYVGSAGSDYSNITGTVSKASVNVTGGKVTSLKPGASGDQRNQIDVSDSGNFSLELSSKAEVGLDSTLQESEILTCEHNLVLVKGTPAKCEQTGTKDSWQCKNCKKLFSDDEAQNPIEQAETIAALGHEYSDPIKVFGCDDKDNAKLTYAICVRCLKYFDASSGDEGQYTELTEAQDQTSDQKFDQHDIAKYGDHPDASIKELKGTEATCTTEGKSTGYSCEVCGDIIVPQVNTLIDVDNHKDANGGDAWGDWKSIDQDSDKYGEYEPPTCTEAGWEYRECKQCGAEEYREAKAKGHSFDFKPENGKDNLDYKEATCTEGGTYRVTCSVCGVLSEIQNVDPLGHQPTKKAAKAPTCTEAGNIYHYHCDRCGLNFKDQACETPVEGDVTIGATNHKNRESYDAIAPTCRESGRKAYVLCKDCNCVISIDGKDLTTPDTFEKVKDQIFVSSDPNAHVYTKLLGEAQAATCTEDGKYAYFKCDVCGNYYKVIDEETKTYEKIEVLEGAEPTEEDLKIKAGHKLGDLIPQQDATCTEPGLKAHYRCSVCEKYFDATDEHEVEYQTLVIPATGHKHFEFVEGKEATCYSTGIKDHYKCSDCGQLFLETEDSENCDITYAMPVNIVPDKGSYSSTSVKSSAKLEFVPYGTTVISKLAGATEIDVTFTVTGVPAGGAKAYLPTVIIGGSQNWNPTNACPLIDVPTDGTYTVSYKGPAIPDDAKIQYMCVNIKNTSNTNTDERVTSITLVSVTSPSVTETIYLNEANEEDIVIPITPHKAIEKVEAVDATCITTGIKEHYKCMDCEKLFLEADEKNYDLHYENVPTNITPDKTTWKVTSVTNKAKIEFITSPTDISGIMDKTPIYFTFTVTGVPAGGALANFYYNTSGNGSSWSADPAKNPSITIPGDGTYTVCYTGPAFTGTAKFSYMGINIKQKNSPATDQSVSSIELVSVTTSLPLEAYLKEANDADLVIPLASHLDEAYNTKVAVAYDDVAATCTTPGWTGGKYCSVCGKVLEARTYVKAKGHNYDQGVVTKDPTCTSDGIKTFTCQNDNCGSTYTEVVPATGHKYGEEGTVTKAATCTADGIKTFTCETCEKTYTEVIPATGHTEETITGKAATCSEFGLTDGTKCSVCNAILVPQTILPKTAHTVVTDAAVEATCTKTGLTEGTHCSVCNAVITAQQVVPKKPHTPVVDEAVEATCTQSGKTAGSHCEVCGGIIEEQTVIPPKAHKPVVDEAVEATCTKSGKTEGSHCEVCGGIIVEQVVIPALGHNYVNGVCTRDGAKQPNYEPPTTSKKPQVTTKVIKITQAKVTKLKVKSKAKKKISANWKKVKGAKGYEIEVSKSSSFKVKAKVLTKTTKKLKLTIKNKKLKSGKTYYVRVRAYTTYKDSNNVTKTAYSNWNYVLRKVKVK